MYIYLSQIFINIVNENAVFHKEIISMTLLYLQKKLNEIKTKKRCECDDYWWTSTYQQYKNHLEKYGKFIRQMLDKQWI